VSRVECSVLSNVSANTAFAILRVNIHIRPEDGNAMFALLDSTQHSTRLTPESRSYTLNSSRENQPKGKNLQPPKRSETRSFMKTI
jgi:hypothetical protein